MGSSYVYLFPLYEQLIPRAQNGSSLAATLTLRALHLVLTTFNWLTIPHLRMVNAGILTPLDFGTGCSSESTLGGNWSRMSPAVARRRRPALCIGKPFPFTTIRLKLQQRCDFKGQELRGNCKYSELEGTEPMPKESGSEAGRAPLNWAYVGVWILSPNRRASVESSAFKPFRSNPSQPPKLRRAGRVANSPTSAAPHVLVITSTLNPLLSLVRTRGKFPDTEQYI